MIVINYQNITISWREAMIVKRKIQEMSERDSMRLTILIFYSIHFANLLAFAILKEG